MALLHQGRNLLGYRSYIANQDIYRSYAKPRGLSLTKHDTAILSLPIPISKYPLT